MTNQIDKSDEKVAAEEAFADREVASPGKPVVTVDQEGCEHDWQPDGQTLTSVQLCCTKCFRIWRSGIDI